MERVIRIAVIFGITLLVGFVAIVVANGDLTWATMGLVALAVLVFGLMAGTWAVVHGQFSKSVEAALTVGIVALIIVGFGIVLAAGGPIKTALAELFGDGAAWWLLSPLAGTVAIVLLFGLHRERS